MEVVLGGAPCVGALKTTTFASWCLLHRTCFVLHVLVTGHLAFEIVIKWVVGALDAQSAQRRCFLAQVALACRANIACRVNVMLVIALVALLIDEHMSQLGSRFL